MRDIPEAFAAHLAGGVTTLCRCWSLRRRDGIASASPTTTATSAFGASSMLPYRAWKPPRPAPSSASRSRAATWPARSAP